MGRLDGPCLFSLMQGGVDFSSLLRFSLTVCSRLADLESEERGRESRENAEFTTCRCLNISGIPQSHLVKQVYLSKD